MIVSIEEKQKIIKNPTNYSLVINHKSSISDYKLPKIRVKPHVVKKVIKKNKPKNVIEEDIEKYQNPKPTQTPIHSEPQQNSRYIRAGKCGPEYCTPPDCRCGGIDIPGIH
jgi:hypothetical protein